MSRKKSLIDKKNLKKFGAQLKALRKTLGLNQVKFGECLGISGNFVSDLESGKASPTMPILLLIEARWSITPDQILTEKGFSLAQISGYNKEYKDFKGLRESQELEARTLPIEEYVESAKHIFLALERWLAIIESSLDSIEESPKSDARDDAGQTTEGKEN